MKSFTEAGGFCAHDLAKLQQQLNAWRGGQARRGRLPEAAWRSAAALARGLGVSHVSRTLRLSYSKLHLLAEEPTAPEVCPPPKTTFLELPLAGLNGSGAPGYRAELGDGTPHKLTFHLGGDLSAVLALAEAFWRRKP